jgi:anti-sigma B factor antagonist
MERGQMDAQPTPEATVPHRVRVSVSTPQPGVTVFAVTGEIDLATVGALRDRLLPEQPWETDTTVVDLSEVSFLGSAGVAVLLDALQRATTENKAFALVVDGAVVSRTLEVTGVADGFVIHRDLDSVLASLD